MLPSGIQPILRGIRRLLILALPQSESLTVRPVPMARPVFFSIRSNMSFPDERILYQYGRRDFTAQAAITCQSCGLMRLATYYLKTTRLPFLLERITGCREHSPQERLLRLLLWKSTSTREATPERSGSMMFPCLSRIFKDIFSPQQFRQAGRKLGFDVDATPSSVQFEQWLKLFDYFKCVGNVQALQTISGSERRLRQRQASLQ